MAKEKTVAIVGAGLAGIATGIRLAKMGYKVTVFDKNKYPGGKMTQLKKHHYRFDAGPSLFTLPHLVDELFTLCGKNPRDYFNYKKLDVLCHYFYEDGTMIRAFADKEKFAEEVNSKTGEDPKQIFKALKKSAFLYDSLAGLFIEKSLHKISTYFSWPAIKAYFRIHKLNFLNTMHEANMLLFSDKRVVQLFNRYATYNGSNPYHAPATLNIIPHLEFNLGAYVPEGGMYDITATLYQLAKDMGVSFELGNGVDKILVEKNRVKGVRVNGQERPFDRVVSNADISTTYMHLLPKEYSPAKLLKQPKSSSAMIFYWGIKGTFPELDVHNIFFARNYQKEFEYLFAKKQIYHDPTVYINVTAKLIPQDAPKGCENWFVMINTPNNNGQDWQVCRNLAREAIINKLNNLLQTNIADLIQYEEVLDPPTIEQRTSSRFGALYGNSSNNKYAAFLRHANYSSKIKGMYFCGGSVHPGGGIPLCLSSARLVSEMIR